MKGRWTLAWARGPGRQSGTWALSFAALAAIPFLKNVAPACKDGACDGDWDKLFFLPELLFIPAVMLVGALVGSWIAQRMHARFDKRFYLTLETDETPEIPPGHLEPKELEHDAIRKTMRWSALGLLATTGIFSYFAMTPIGLRACDPWEFSQPTGLQVCDGASQWSDALIAYQVWVFIAISAFWGLGMLLRSRRFSAPKKRRVPGVRRAKVAHP